MLLESGTLTEDELEKAGYRGKVVNFKWDIESSLEATIVQKVRNQRDKAFGVNVLCGGDPLEIYTATDGEVIFKNIRLSESLRSLRHNMQMCLLNQLNADNHNRP